MPGIGIITNPHSNINKRKPHTPKLLGYILGAHGRLEVTQSLEDLQVVAKKFRDSEIEILAINGGDGTISQTLTAFVRAYGERPLPKIALLRGGTMNVLAANLGIRGTSQKLLYKLCESFSDGLSELQTHSLDSLEVEGQIGFLYADGTAYRFLEEFYKNKNGFWGALWKVIQVGVSTLLRGKLFRQIVRKSPVKLLKDGKDIQGGLNHASCGIFAATIKYMPFGVKVFHGEPGMEFFSVTCEPAQVLWRLPQILFGRGSNDQVKIGSSCQSLAIPADKGYTYSLDGELFQSSHDTLLINRGPKFEFVVL